MSEGEIHGVAAHSRLVLEEFSPVIRHVLSRNRACRAFKHKDPFVIKRDMRSRVTTSRAFEHEEVAILSYNLREFVVALLIESEKDDNKY